MRELLITKTVGTIQAYTNQGAPVKVCSLIPLRFNMEQLYTLFPVLSPEKFNVSNFTKKMGYIFTLWPACVCVAFFEWHNLYTALLVLCRVDCALKVLKNYKPQNTMRKCILSLSILT